MATTNLKTMRNPLTPSVERGDLLLRIKRSAMVATTKLKTTIVPPLQVKCEKGHKSLTTKSVSVSRREMMHCLTAGVLGLTFLPKPAEARPSRIEMKKMIMEKLQELREKVGLSKPNTENGTVSPKKPSTEDKKSPTLPLPPPENKAPSAPEDKKSPTLPLPAPEGTAPLVDTIF